MKVNTGGYLSINGLACQHTPQSFVKSTSKEMSTLRIKLYNDIVSYSDELIINFGNIDCFTFYKMVRAYNNLFLLLKWIEVCLLKLFIERLGFENDGWDEKFI